MMDKVDKKFFKCLAVCLSVPVSLVWEVDSFKYGICHATKEVALALFVGSFIVGWIVFGVYLFCKITEDE